VPKVAVVSKTAPKPVPKAVFATKSSDANSFILRMAEIHGIDSGALLCEQRPRVRSGLFASVESWKQRQAESDEEWMRQIRSQRETPTATTLDAIDAATTTAIDVGAHPEASIDATMSDDDAMNEQKKTEIIIRTFEMYGVEMGPRLRSGDTTINAKTTPCIVNRPCGSRHSVIPRRLHDAFVIMVSFFRELLSVALDTAHWYQKRPMPTHCWLVRELEKYKQFYEIMGVPEQSDVGRIKMRELGTHASHFCRKKWRNGGDTSVQIAERIASYANSGIDDQPFLNEPVIMMFQHGKASRTAQKLQMSQLTKQDLLLYTPGEMPKEPKDYYSNVLPARKIIENPDVCHDKGANKVNSSKS
jgi:hypothetical protein